MKQTKKANDQVEQKQRIRSCYMIVQSVISRRAFQPSGSRAVIIARGTGTVMYESKRCDDAESARGCAAKFLASKRGAHLRIEGPSAAPAEQKPIAARQSNGTCVECYGRGSIDEKETCTRCNGSGQANSARVAELEQVAKTDEEVRTMVTLAGEVLAAQIAQLATEIIDAANDSAKAPSPPRMMWNRWDLAIAAWLNDAGQVSWVVKLGGAQTEAPSVVEALRGLLAIVKRFPRVTERAV